MLALALLTTCKENRPREKVHTEDEQRAAPPPDLGKTLLVVQSTFSKKAGKKPVGLARLLLLHRTKEGWVEERIEDPESSVFHAAVPWRDGILTIGGTKALLKHWRCSAGKWAAETLWERSWGGKFDRLRDIEIADVDGDGKEEIVLATHDKGVVAVGDEAEAQWSFTELGQADDTFVHEVEVGDLDGDGRLEIYATPSQRNRASGESQPGAVVRYQRTPKGYARTELVSWEHSHAKEILTADLDEDGKDELYVVREAHTKREGDSIRIIDPVRIQRLTPRGPKEPWEAEPIAQIKDRQSRFLVGGDVDGDGRADLVAAGMTSGLWLLQQDEMKSFTRISLDRDSGGYEHATHLADLDGDGRPEIYVAADRQKKLRRYRYDGASFRREDLVDLDASSITWNINDADITPCSRAP